MTRRLLLGVPTAYIGLWLTVRALAGTLAARTLLIAGVGLAAITATVAALVWMQTRPVPLRLPRALREAAWRPALPPAPARRALPAPARKELTR